MTERPVQGGGTQPSERFRAEQCQLGRWLVGGVVLAAGAVVVLSVLAGSAPYQAVGDSDPGLVVAVGAPLLRLAADLAATVCVGALAFVVFCTRPQASGVVSPEAYREVRIAGWSAMVWWLSAVALVPVSAADTAGVPLHQVLTPQPLVTLLGATEPPKAWLVSAVVVLVVTLGCRAALHWPALVMLLGLAVFALLPPVVTAHGSADLGHDIALGALVVHVPTAVLWIGMALAVGRQVRRAGPIPALAARYSRLAGACWLLLVGTGVVLSTALMPAGQLFSPGYGLLLLAKIAVVAALGIVGTVLRRRVLRQATGVSGRGRQVMRFSLAELVLLLGAVGMSVELTHLSLPDTLSRATTTTQALLGYDLAGPPTLLRLITDWRLDMFFGPLAALLGALYLLGVYRLRTLGQRWPVGRTAAWLTGCLVLLFATSSGLGRYAAAMFSMHIASHMLVSMLVPALLVLGGPVTLLRAAVPPAPGALPGPREWLTAVRASPAARMVTHPVVMFVLFVGSPFALYFTDLFDTAVRFHWAHLAINAWFLAIGYLFLWPIIGQDPAPKPLPNLARLALVLAMMPADIAFGVALASTHRVIGNGTAASNMYQALALPWVPDLLADQHLAGILALALGEFTQFVVLIALLARWYEIDTAHQPSLDGYDTLLQARAQQLSERPRVSDHRGQPAR